MNKEDYKIGTKFRDGMGVIWMLKINSIFFVVLVGNIKGGLRRLRLDAEDFKESIEDGTLIEEL